MKTKTIKQKRNKTNVVCECGIKVFGNSDINAVANLKQHMKSKLHKKQLGN